MWYDELSDEQIQWLQENKVPWYLLTEEQKNLFKHVPDILLQTIVEICHEYVWEPLPPSNKNIPITFEKTVVEVCHKSVWGPVGNPNKPTSGIYRLDPNWERPTKPKPIYTVPYRNENCPFILIPLPCYPSIEYKNGYPYKFLHVLRGCADWLWIKWEWFDKKDNRNYIWYEFPGGITRGDIPDTGQNLREYNENPPLPVLVKWKNE